MLGEALSADRGRRGSRVPCGNGHQAAFAGYQDKTFDTVLGPVTVTRAWYHCAQCGHALAPRDAELGVAGQTMSPGLAAMNDIAAAAGPFAGAARLLEELAGIRLTAKRVERAAEASGTALALACRQRARLTASRKLVPLPPSPLPDKLYAVIDGTGVPLADLLARSAAMARFARAGHVLGSVPGALAERHAAPRPASWRLITWPAAAVAHGPERLRGKRREHRRVPADGLGCAVPGAQPGDEHLVGVALIYLRARWAEWPRGDCRTALDGSVHCGDHFRGGWVVLARPAAQPDGLAALSGGVIRLSQQGKAPAAGGCELRFTGRSGRPGTGCCGRGTPLPPSATLAALSAEYRRAQQATGSQQYGNHWPSALPSRLRPDIRC